MSSSPRLSFQPFHAYPRQQTLCFIWTHGTTHVKLLWCMDTCTCASRRVTNELEELVATTPAAPKREARTPPRKPRTLPQLSPISRSANTYARYTVVCVHPLRAPAACIGRVHAGILCAPTAKRSPGIPGPGEHQHTCSALVSGRQGWQLSDL